MCVAKTIFVKVFRCNLNCVNLLSNFRDIFIVVLITFFPCFILYPKIDNNLKQILNTLLQVKSHLFVSGPNVVDNLHDQTSVHGTCARTQVKRNSFVLLVTENLCAVIIWQSTCAAMFQRKDRFQIFFFFFNNYYSRTGTKSTKLSVNFVHLSLQRKSSLSIM